MTIEPSRNGGAAGTIVLRRPRLQDGKAVHELIRRCPPLDLNSSYSYFLLCSHYAETCVVAEHDAILAGFLSAYRLPQEPHTLFVWQVAVDAVARGRGLANQMLAGLMARPSCQDVRYIETTVSPSNAASRRVFARFAAQRQAGWREEVFLNSSNFGSEAHEEEVLFRIGPLSDASLS